MSDVSRKVKAELGRGNAGRMHIASHVLRIGYAYGFMAMAYGL